MLERPSISIRAPRMGDGAGLAHSWLDAATHYTHHDAKLFQVPAADGLSAFFNMSVYKGGFV
jgi:hypothetical protein